MLITGRTFVYFLFSSLISIDLRRFIFQIELKGSFYANYNTTILDCATVTIGTRVMFGPNVSLYAATHGTSVKERQTDLERASEIVIGDDCWIGGGGERSLRFFGIIVQL